MFCSAASQSTSESARPESCCQARWTTARRACALGRYTAEIANAEKRAALLRELMNDIIQGVSMSHEERTDGNPTS